MKKRNPAPLALWFLLPVITLLSICPDTRAVELTDRSQLSPGNTEIDFDDQPVGVVNNPVNDPPDDLVIGEVTFSSVQNLHIYQPSADGYSPPAELVSGLLLRANPDALFSFPYSDIRIDFANPVAEVGFSWWDTTYADNLIEVYDSQDQLLESARFPAAGSGGSVASFAGIRRGSNEIAYVIARVAADNEVGGIDNVSYGFAAPVVEGDGKDIAYVSDTGEIWMMNLDGSGKRSLKVAENNFLVTDVQLHPAGEWIAFGGVDFDSGDSGLWLMQASDYDANTNPPQLLAPDYGYQKRASWHPGGGWIAYLDNNSKVCLLEVFDGDGEISVGSPEVITDASSSVWCTDVAFAPDGRNLLVCQFDADLALIEVFDANGTRTANLIGNPLAAITDQAVGRAKWPSFSADGKKILFHSIKQYTNSEPRFVTENAIAVLTIRDSEGALTPEHHTSNPRIFLTTPTEDLEETPSWSPDGTRIAFVEGVPSGVPGIPVKNIVSINSGEPEHATNNPRVFLAGNSEYPSFAHIGGGGGFLKEPSPVPLNLISWWPGENAAWDVAGIGQGSMKNSEDFDPYDVGKVGRAFWFDGVDDYIEGRSGGMSLVQNFSIEVWVNPLSHSAEQIIVSKKNPGDDDVSYSLLLRDGRPLFRSSMGGIEHEVGPSNVTLPLDEWSHLAFTESDSALKLYLNGVLVGLTAAVPNRPVTTGPFTIGAFVDDTHPTATPGSPFDGLVDELSLYNRALSGTEIELIYQAGKAGKARHDPARDFSATKNPNLPWRYGWVDGAGAPVPSRVTLGNPDLGGLFPTNAVLEDTTYVYGAEPGAHMLFNNSKTDRAYFEGGDGMTTTQIDIAPRQFAFHPSVGGDNDYTVLHWTAPEAGKYALSATFTGVEDSPANTDVHLFSGDTELFAGTVDTFLGNGTSVTEEVDLSESDTVTWVVGDGAGTVFDYTGVVASAVKLDDFQPFRRPELTRINFKAPIMNGKTVTFNAFNPDKPANSGMSAKLQYSATPGVPGSWVDLPGGVMTSSTPTSQTFVATVNNLPVGTFAFRVATTVDGLGTTFSAPSDTFEILAAAPFLEIEQDVSSASDPTGDTTHRGDSLTYTARFRNSGGLPALPGDAVQVLVRVPDGTTVVAAGSTPGYETVVSGGVTFAKWTLNRQLNPFDAPQTFTVESVTSDLIRSANHGFEDGDEVRVESSEILPGGLSAGSVYRIVSSTSNTFRLSGPPPVNGVNILSTGSGTHTVRRVDSWQRRTLKLAVADPPISSESTVDDVDFGDTLTTFARITDRFHGLGGIADSETFATEVVSPLRLTAADPVVGVTQDPNAPGFEVRQGSFVTVDFTIRNEASYRMNETFVRVFAPDGLTILSGVFTSGSGNPTVSETPDGEQLLVFECGPLDPGAERVCQARFRVQYDFPFTEPQNSIDFLFATASTSRPPLVVYDTKRYKKYYFKKNPRTGKKVRKFYWRTRKVPRNDARNGLERDLENPFQLIVGESPGIPKAILEISEFSQSGLGSAANAPDLFRDIPKEQRPHLQHVEMVADSTAPVPYSNPSRLSSELLLRVDFQNTGNARSEFNRIKLKIPATMTYVAGSASVRAPDGIINPTPTIQNGYYVFTVPFLDPGDTNNLTFKVKLKPGTPVGSFVFHESPTILSRDLRQNFPPLRPGLLAYSVAPGVMDYTRSIIPHFITDQDNKIIGVNKWEYQMDYFSRGGIAANGVGIRYYIPPGERFQEAYFSDFSGTKLTALQSRVVAPAANSPSGTVIFNVGQVVSKASGRVVVVTVPDSPNLPDRDIYGEQSDSAWETYDSSTGPPTGRREITVPKASVLIDAPTRHFTPLHADPFLVIEGRIAAHIGDQITYQIAMGNSGTNDVDQGFLAVPIPEGARFVSYQPVGNDHGNADVHNLLAPNTGYGFNDGRDRNYLFSDLDNLHGCLIVPVSIGINGSVVVKVTLEMTGNEQSFVVLQPKLILETRTLAGAAFQTFRPKASDPLNVQLSAVYSKFMGTAAAASLGTADQPNNLFLGHRGNLSLESRSVSVIGADFLQTTDGHVIVQSGSKIVAAGGGNVVANDGAGLISNGAAVVANDGAGFMMTGDSDKVTLRIPGFGRATAQFALNNIVNIVAGGGGNIVAAGGGNLVRPVALVGSQNVMIAASLIGQDGAGFATYLQFGDGSRKFVLADASEVLLPSLTSNSLMASAGLIGQDGAGLVGQDGAGLIGKGGAGIVAGGGGNIFFANRNNFIPQTAIVAAGGGNIVAAGGGNIVAAGGGNILALSPDSFVRAIEGIVAAGGGN